MGNDPVFSVSEFVGVMNQTMEYAYPSVVITGELAQFRVSKNRWVYFNLQDDDSSVKFFGTVYQLKTPLEDGMMLEVRGMPRLHPQFGFSVTIQSVRPVGEGSLKKAANLLEAQLRKEGLFDEQRKRIIPSLPKRVGLVASGESAAYHDFMTLLAARWGGIEIVHTDVQVQGEPAPAQIVAALHKLNQLPEPLDVIVMTRGGGSAEDLAAFNTEQVTRAVAASRVPTIVAIGHEVDISLAELAADLRASTPSNAAELLVPDRRSVQTALVRQQSILDIALVQQLGRSKDALKLQMQELGHGLSRRLEHTQSKLAHASDLLAAYNPSAVLQRGYALVRLRDGSLVNNVHDLTPGQRITATLQTGTIEAEVKGVE